LNALPLVRAQRTLSKQAHAVVGQAQPRALSHWSHSPVAAVAGIAQPEVFFQALRAQGLQVVRCHVRPDHHDFLEVLNPDNELRQETLPLFCTEKDAVKLRSLLMRAPLERQPDLWAVPLALDIDAQFWKALEARLKDLSISP
jgi:tetraacyldisaccharide 4'-kinase